MPAALKLSLTPTPEDHAHARVSSGLRRQLILILTDEFSYEDIAIVTPQSNFVTGVPAALKLSLTPTPEDHTHAPISSGLRRQVTLILTDEFSYEDVAIVLCSVFCAAAARRSVFCAAKQNKNQPPYQESWVAGFSWVRSTGQILGACVFFLFF